MRSYRVGLTGGLASGKSTVSRLFSEAGFFVFDADRLVADLYRPGGKGAAAIRQLFGPEMLDTDQGVDHQRLAVRVFGDSAARQLLERTVHPLVRERFEKLSANFSGVIVLEATLLVEAGFAPEFDLVVTVEGPSEVRLARAMARGMAEHSARSRLLAQGEGDERRAGADLTLRNDGSLEELYRATERLIEEIRHKAREKGLLAGGASHL